MRYWLCLLLDAADKHYIEHVAVVPPRNSIQTNKLVDLHRSMKLNQYQPEEYQVWDSLRRVWLSGCDILRVAAELEMKAAEKRDQLRADKEAKQQTEEYIKERNAERNRNRGAFWDALDHAAAFLMSTAKKEK